MTRRLPSAMSLRRFFLFCIVLVGGCAQAGDPTCWQGAFAHMKFRCCVLGDKACWDSSGTFTFQRCCAELRPPGDATCWAPPYDYYSCCTNYLRWFPRQECFDPLYTFERCCGGHLAVIVFGMRRWVYELSHRAASLCVTGHPWIHLAVASLFVRASAAVMSAMATRWRWRERAKGTAIAPLFSSAAASDESDGYSSRVSTVHVPAVSALRVLATCCIVAWHSLGNCGHGRTCKTLPEGGVDLATQVVSSFLVVFTDVFFVISAYLSALGGAVSASTVASTRDLHDDYLGAAKDVRSDTATSPSAVDGVMVSAARTASPAVAFVSRLRTALVDSSARILRRVTRTAPTLLLANSLKLPTVSSFLVAAWPGLYVGATYPGDKPTKTWPFGVELLCFVALEALLVICRVVGRHVGLFAGVSVLAACLERWRREAPRHSAGMPFVSSGWQMAHVAIGAHRLPISLTTWLLVTAVVRRRRAARPPADNVVMGATEATAAPAAAASAAATDAGNHAAFSHTTRSRRRHGAEVRVEGGSASSSSGPSDHGVSFGRGMEVGEAAEFKATEPPWFCWLLQSHPTLVLAAAWTLVAVGLAVTASLEWCWNFGPRVILPWWIYPFPAKLPFLFGCVTLLETSRATAEAQSMSVSKVGVRNVEVGHVSPQLEARSRTARGMDGIHVLLSALERRSLAMLVTHEYVETRIVQVLPAHTRDLAMFFFELPAMLVWSYVAASTLVWTADPFHKVLHKCLIAARAAANTARDRSPWLVVTISAAIMSLAGLCIGVTVRLACWEPLSPCLL
eukprot:TRINITY_DN55661_c0_g1_i1.p1 TRINITY_DN55661_c0_g1~~TRINITY_DN55661_c0_g1_i1.p1  ORF type:complete len:795 (+),score=101.08 TRINITY_DN55661_c0_g1_i1:47-2431(+)